MNAVNITGGEPFIRDDLEDIVDILKTKTSRIVFSTSGYYSEKIIKIAQKYPFLGFRISLEGLSCKNDELRGRSGGFDKGLFTLLELKRMGIKDIGFGITVSNNNSPDMLNLYELNKNLKMEFATAAFHNSYYFHKYDNVISNKDEVGKNFDELIQRLMRENTPKSWFRAFFNLGLINYIHGGKRLLPCEAGTENFFLDPFGNILPCNGMEETCWFDIMGNLNDADAFMDIWNSKKADDVRRKVSSCPKNCWMIGSVSPVMRKYIKGVIPWVISNKIKSIRKQKIDTSRMPKIKI
jgi:radical SAM protein with 4Fe4S-binding SPASM domain